MANDMDRRDFLKLGMAVGAAAAASTMLPKKALASYTTISLSDCMDMTPQDMAEASAPVNASRQSLNRAVKSISNPKIQSVVAEIIENPAPGVMSSMGKAERAEAAKELAAKGMTKVSAEKLFPPFEDPAKAPQPFYAAPGSGWTSHHSYPGGLATHTALNVNVSKSLYDGYRDVYGYMLDRDVVLTSQLLHDLHKPWVFQWRENGECRTEQTLAGTGEHHVLGVAESVKRGLPAEVCVAQACAHSHPRTPEDEAKVVGWIQAASIIAGVDPVKAGLLAADGRTLPLPRRQEGFVTHLGDHDWVLTVPAAQWLIPVMQKIAVEKYGLSEDELKGKKFNALRNYVFSQAAVMNLYEIYAAKGEDELTKTVLAIVKPA